jgi:hypothetical protein
MIRERGFAFGRVGTTLVQVRARQLGLADVERVSDFAHLVRAQISSRSIAFLGILEEEAEVPAGDVRIAQAAQMRAFLADPRVHLCGAILGSGPRTTMLRAVVRLAGLGQPRMGTASSVREAATWLAARGVRESVETIMEAAERLRALARDADASEPPPSSRHS